MIYPLPTSIRVDREVLVRMRDGEHLAVTIYRPQSPDRMAAILSVTAYGRDSRPDEYLAPPQPDRSLGKYRISVGTARGAPDPAIWIAHGYAVVIADARGYFASTGTPGIVSRDDAEDYAELIDWVGAQAWCSGAVGLAGASSP